MADKRGATVANYVEVKNFIKDNGRAIGVQSSRYDQRRYPLIYTPPRSLWPPGPWSDELIAKDTPTQP